MRSPGEVLFSTTKRILRQASKVIGSNSTPRQGYRHLGIHTPVSASEPPFLALTRTVLRGQEKTSFFCLESRPFAKAAEMGSDFRGRIRRSIYRSVAKEFCDTQMERILVIPSGLLDIVVGIAAADITGAPMALLISDELLEDLEKRVHLTLEALTKAHFTVTANEETRAKLQLQFGERIWRLPRLDPDANPSAGQQPADQILHTLEWIWDGASPVRVSSSSKTRFSREDHCPNSVIKKRKNGCILNVSKRIRLKYPDL